MADYLGVGSCWIQCRLRQAEDGSYYVQLDGSNNIYLMSADKLSAFQGLNYDDYPESEEESTESETSAE